MARVAGWSACIAGSVILAGCAAFGSSALEFTPTTLPVRKGPLIAVHVRRDFETRTNQPVRIYVSSPGERLKLWTIAAPTGAMDSGGWMHDGSTITVRSSKGRLRGIRTLEATPCKKSAWKHPVFQSGYIHLTEIASVSAADPFKGAIEMNDSITHKLRREADAFEKRLSEIKRSSEGTNWYPYQSMSNISHLCHILPTEVMERLVAGSLDWRVLDVGAADGDLGYFFESRGSRVDFLENPSTNYNDCKGITTLRAKLNSAAGLVEQDIDRNIVLGGQYDFALALGLLYHLRNPMAFLMALAEHAERMVLSTRVASYLPDGTNIEKSSVAYLLRCRESNNDPTNYWTFSPTGLETALKRCGWKVNAKAFTGTARSNPVDADADQRMFVYCERVENWRDLGKHHDF